MTIQALRTLCALSLAALLAACGSGSQIDQLDQTAGSIQTAASIQTDIGNQAAPHEAAQVASANDPQPDCAPEGCKGLRIIDANAETFRYDALHRADLPQS
jgi:hypothetical protein